MVRDNNEAETDVVYMSLNSRIISNFIAIMTLKGFYPSLCLGFELCTSTVALVSGFALSIMGIFCVVNPIDKASGLNVLGFMAIALGILAATGCLITILGSCIESTRSIKYGAGIGLFCGIMALIILIMAALMSGSLNQTLAHAWNDLDPTTRGSIESEFLCCGYMSLTQASLDCQSDTICSEPVTAELKRKAEYVLYLCGLLLFFEFLSALLSAAVFSMMKKQKEKEMRKMGLNLQDEASDGYTASQIKVQKQKREPKGAPYYHHYNSKKMKEAEKAAAAAAKQAKESV